MADVIDELKVQIDASTKNADVKLDKFIAKMESLQKAVTGLSGFNASGFANGLSQLATSIQDFSSKTKAADFNRVAKGLDKLAAVNAQGLESTAAAMTSFATSMTGLGQMTFNADNLTKMVNSVTKLGGANATQALTNLPQISTLLKAFITDMNTVGSVAFNFDSLANLVNNISRLGGAKATQAVKNLEPIKRQILRFVSGLNGIGTLSFDTTGLANLVSSITKLGGKAAGNAIPNIQNLGVALNQLMATLSRAPAVSQNTILMTQALAQLASNGSKVSSATSAISGGLSRYTGAAGKAMKSTKGLAAQIGMFYARCFLLVRGVKSLWKSTEKAMDYIETLNYFDAAWSQVADNAVNSWKEAGYDSAEAYANSFSQRAQSVTGKMTGFTADDSGNLKATGQVSLGLDPEKLMNYQATFGQMASSMGVASETSLKLSQALTEIGADLASVKNLDFASVWNDMASGMVGMSRTLDKYGVNIRNVNLQEKLSELGIDAKVSKLGQEEKALLRVIILLQSTKYAWGDLADTINQPANQLRLLEANFGNLARTIGSLFLPIVTKVLPYLNAMAIALQRLFSWIGSLLGIKMSGFGTSIGSAAADWGDMEDAAGGVADSTGDAAKNTKKMADNLQGFDKLNVISTKSDSGSGSGAGAGGGVGADLTAAFDKAFEEYQQAWDAAFANVENSAQQMADKIQNAFKQIWDAAEPARKSIKALWDEGLSRLGTFTWTALKDFYSEFLVPLGKWTLGTGLPMLVDSINAFLMKIDFPAINDALRNFWQALEPFAESVGTGLIKFFGDLLSIGADFINAVVPNALNGIASALKAISPETAEKIGYALGVIGVSLLAIKTGISALVGISTTMKAIETSSDMLKKKLEPLFGTNGLLGATNMSYIAGGMKAVFGNVMSGVMTPMQAMGTQFGVLGTIATALAGISTTVAGSTLAVSKFFNMWKNGFSWVNEALMVLGVAIAGVGAVILGAPALVAAGVAGVVVALATAAIKIHDNWDSIVEFFQSIPGRLKNVWDSVTSTADQSWKSFVAAAQSVPDKIGSTVNSIAKWFSQIPGKIGYALGYALGTITKWTVDVINYWSVKIPETIENVRKWFAELPDKIYNAIVGAIEHIGTWGTEVYNSFSKKVSETITAVSQWFAALPQNIYDEIIKIKERITDWGDKTIDFFKVTVPTIVSNVVSFFSDLPKQIMEVGENVIRGLWEGMNNMTKWIGDNIKNFVNGVIRGFKDGFDEHSPSKIAFKIGDFFTVGLGNGLVDKFDDVYADVQSFTDKISGINMMPECVDPNVKISRDIVDSVAVHTNYVPSVPVFNGTADVSSFSTEVHAALSGAIDYDRLGEAVYKAQTRAMRENPTVIDKGDIVDAWKAGAKAFRKQTGRQLGIAY